MSQDSEEQQKQSTSASSENSDQIQEQPAVKKRPVIGKPIATPPSSTSPPQPSPSQPVAQAGQQPPPAKPLVGRPRIGTPIGTVTAAPTQTQQSTAQTLQSASQPAQRPVIGKPRIGTPVGTPAQASSQAPAPQAQPAAPRPVVSRPAVAGVGRPAIPAKPQETKAEITRRNFIKGLVIFGGIATAGGFGLLYPFLTGTVKNAPYTKQQIFDAASGSVTPLTVDSIPENDWRTFIWPRTNNSNVDADTFSQCVIIHLPKGFVAPSNLAYKDPVSGDYFCAFSRVCVHLWCLWSYVPRDKRMECPCHGSQYVPGGVPGSLGSTEPGIAVAGPASLQTAPNNQLPMITLTTDANGNFYATSLIGAIGCGQKCAP